MKQAPPLKAQLGRTVTDGRTGAAGTLMAVVAYSDICHIGGLNHLGRTEWVAFVRPLGGGREWVTTPDAVTAPAQ
ncbi:hypothetical protein [Streptomyces sp. ODS28]|uniref:hypothetical protein n=1 Tax=Streptomyces sp. ODS28 TaxID=3136688 RepID=UPI0031E7DCB7